MNDQEFLGLLESLLKPDTELVQKATASLNKNYYTSPASLAALLRVITSDQKQELRQLAAVEARKLVSRHWTSLSAEQKQQVREQLLQAALKEDAKLVRHSIARIISSVAKVDFGNGEWTELPEQLTQAAASSNVRQREVGVYIIFTLMESMGDFFMDSMGTLLELFSKTVQDQESSEVRINTLLTLGNIAMVLDTDDDPAAVKSYQDIIPSMVGVLKNTIDEEDDAAAMQAFEVFQTLIACDPALLQKHFGDLLKFMMQISSNTELDDDYRDQALAFLMQAVRYRKLKVQGLRIGEDLTVGALKIVTELGELITDDEEITPARSALGLLDILASSLPPSQVVVPLLKAIGPYIQNENPDYRRAGILALGMCVEGAPDFIATQLTEILPVVLRLLADPNIRVRAAALNAVARLSDDLAEEIGKEHDKLIPAMVVNFDAALKSLPTSSGADHEEELGIVRGSCNAIDSFIEGLEEEEARKYLPELVPRFSPLFTHDDIKVKSAAINAIGSLAAAVGEAFMVYFEDCMRALGQYISIKDSQEDLDLRGIVCDSIGKIASAVGAEPFKRYVQPLMQSSEEALHLDHPRLRECSYILWSTMAKVYQEDFAQYLDGVMKGLNDCLAQEEEPLELELGEHAADLLGQEVTIAGKKVKVAAVADGDDDDEFEDIEDIDDDDITAVTAIAMEKEIAVEVIGDVLSETKEKFLPYLEKTIQTVLQLVEHGYEGVRKSAITTLWRAYATLWEMAEEKGMPKWKPGIPLNPEPSDELKKLGDLVMKATLATWQDEMDRGTVTDINRSLHSVFKSCGPAVLIAESGTVVQQITNQLLAIITKRHPCQQDLGGDGTDANGDDDDDFEESSEYDWLVIDTAIDVLAGLSAALGTQFGELWKIFEKPVVKYASSQDIYERSSAVGGIAEMVGHMKEAVTPFTDKLMKVMVHRINDDNNDVKANAVYAAGLLCEVSTDDKTILSFYGPILMKLQPLLQDDTPPRLLDNAAGCVARMIQRFPEKVPLQEVLPSLIELLPAKEDYEENKATMACIIHLYRTGNELMKQLTPQVAPVLQKVLGEPEEQLEDDLRTQLTELVQWLRSQG